ncbi:hypothetical protein [Aeromonas caviae]|uniref:hypothetical protein n=1 Tax=Aeromonas caviae TaxID=648 RepID=UPI00313E48AE
MIKIDNFIGSAPKIGGDGYIEYELWVDCSGLLYVRIVDNIISTSTPGTFNSILFQVSKYVSHRCASSAMTVSQGYDMNSNTTVPVNDNNTSAFLKAILRHLIPC